ncbi:MAG: hypothetical protein ACTSU0_04975, partial [Alphaproteobacteria bacterium]
MARDGAGQQVKANRKVDPVSAIAEVDATGRTAQIFTDIRDVMQIPLVTSIWRTLDDVDGGLEAVWSATRPIYLSGLPDELLAKMEAEIEFPVPARLTWQRMREAGLKAGDRSEILAVFDAYNRSNGLNLIALTALARRAEGSVASARSRPKSISWPQLTPLLGPDEIGESEWALLKRAAHIGLKRPDDEIPTLWRHLLRWPAAVDLFVRYFEPLHSKGVLLRTVGDVEEFVEAHAP